MRIPFFKLLKPHTVAEAWKMRKADPNNVFIAGGTDYIPLMKYGLKHPNALILLKEIESLKTLHIEGKKYSIGTGVNLTELREHNLFSIAFPSLSKALAKVATPQIRNMATLGGNLLQDRRCIYFNQTDMWRSELPPCFKLGGRVCHQIPNAAACRALYYSDLAPALLSLGAKVRIFDGKEQEVELADILKEHSIRNGSEETVPYVLTEILLEIPEKKWTCFEKYAIRESLNFPLLNIALCAHMEGNRLHTRIFVGAVHAFPLEMTELEGYLQNKDFDKIHHQEALQLAFDELERKYSSIREAGIDIKAKKNLLLKLPEAIARMLSAFSIQLA